MPRNYSIQDTIEQERQRRLSILTTPNNIVESEIKTQNIENLSINSPVTETQTEDIEDIVAKPKGFFGRLFGWK